MKSFYPAFHGLTQQDSMDFMRSLLDRLHEELKTPLTSTNLSSVTNSPRKSSRIAAKSTNNPTTSSEMESVIGRSFGGILKSEVKCMQCNSIFIKEDSFLDLSVQISSDSTSPRLNNRSFVSNLFSSIGETLGFSGNPVLLEKCLEAFCSPEILDGKDRYWCEKCKQHVASTKTLTISRAPEILCIQLKRFKHEGYFSSKINTQVIFPIEGLELKPFLNDQSSHKYDLFGFISHRGSINGGHYVSYCKHESGQWLEYDDSYVTPFAEKDIANVQAYILFYRLCDPKGIKKNLDGPSVNDVFEILLKFALSSFRLRKESFYRKNGYRIGPVF